ncbi:hypothetical protein SB359474_4725 [Shigella boydii 3594-74]|nr:hypothetical protein SB359474_4725 [Shigella boydii 3594-74]EGJ83713.1 hypothetical protein SF274771_4040 [Shigella flexneri 2747-71]EGK18677.1 hypothetical protein SFK218_4383 [Shigella flexneri K-218]EGW78674.1 hypothetical protein ECSTEC94C_4915 [Escherichia coli STEC_94C]EJZ62607.1 hypothetical protein SF148580_3909 [Shigella flexneri 1485-80]
MFSVNRSEKEKGINKLKIRRAFIFILVIGASSELRHCCNGGFYCFSRQ